jgi:hypothetical protein
MKEFKIYRWVCRPCHLCLLSAQLTNDRRGCREVLAMERRVAGRNMLNGWLVRSGQKGFEQKEKMRDFAFPPTSLIFSFCSKPFCPERTNHPFNMLRPATLSFGTEGF